MMPLGSAKSLGISRSAEPGPTLTQGQYSTDPRKVPWMAAAHEAGQACAEECQARRPQSARRAVGLLGHRATKHAEGIAPRALRDLFSGIRAAPPSQFEYHVSLQYVQASVFPPTAVAPPSCFGASRPTL